MILHPSENVVIYVAEEMDFWFHAPVVPRVGECRMFVEHAAVPATHLVVADHVAVLHFLLVEDVCGFVEQVAVDPVRDSPMFFGYEF